MKKNKVTVFQGEGRITAPGKVTVAGADGAGSVPQELEAKHIILATGSVPIDLPTMPVDGDTVVTSTEALSFEAVPKKLVVIGAGAIGLELGSVWARLGADVTVVEFLPRIAPGFDLELAKELAAFPGEGRASSSCSKPKSTASTVKDGAATVRAAGKDGKELILEADKVLVAVGRKATLGNAVA